MLSASADLGGWWLTALGTAWLPWLQVRTTLLSQSRMERLMLCGLRVRVSRCIYLLIP
jgi:hypothetical protein